MAKQKISDKLQAKFEKPQFQLGAAVFFSWLGQKKQGYVKAYKTRNWGIQYTVETVEGIRYPCGIQIEGQKTAYNTGFIFYEATKSTGDTRRSKPTKNKPNATTDPTISRVTGGSAPKSKDDHTIQRADDAELSRETDSETGHGNKHDVKPSATRVHRSNSKKRANSAESRLEDAVQRQRDFLNGFVKRD